MSRPFDSMLVRTSCAIIFVLALGTTAAIFPQTGSNSGRVIVQLKSGVSTEDFCRRNGLTLIDSIPGGALLVEADATTLAQAVADDAVASTEPDLPVDLSETAILDPAVLALLNPDMVDLLKDPAVISTGRNFFKKSMVTQRGLDKIKKDDALQLADGSGILVAVLDTGIDATHPALLGSSIPGFNFLTDDVNTNELMDLPPQTIEALRTSASLNPAVLALLNPTTVAFLDPAALSFLTAPPLYFGHGTLVSGLIHLIAPGALIMPVRVFDASGRSTSFRIAKAIRYAVDRGVHVINMSFDMQQLSPLVSEALDYAADRGVILVASVGNGNSLVDATFPASHPAVLGVAATNRDDRKARFSNYGAAVKVAAPGDSLISTYPAGLYAGIGGTSFAAAVVSAE
ncbi:MAG TPA: S8 family serine peptidase, partial [Terriglobia bacterium]|nr:S8 family serine peptidase [Terriglobia bacterium]